MTFARIEHSGLLEPDVATRSLSPQCAARTGRGGRDEHAHRTGEFAESLDTDLPRCGTCAQPLGSWATDRLTGLLDRWGWDDKAPAAFRRAQRRWEDVALLLVDLDWFKKINDDLGHPAGDRVLKEVADVLLRNTRRHDLVSRYGGDEFLVLLPQVSLPEALSVAERTLQDIQTLKVAVTMNSGSDVTLKGLTASIGLAAYVPERNQTLVGLVRDTDSALQRAKANGRSQIRVFDPAARLDHDGHEDDNADGSPESLVTSAAPAPRLSIVDGAGDLRTLLNLRHLVNADWMPDVLHALADGPKRHGDLLNAIRSIELIDEWSGRDRNIQTSILNRTLRRLVDNGFVLRYEEPGVWPRSVRYELSQAAREWLSEILPVVSRWCDRHSELITHAQRHRPHSQHLNAAEDTDPHSRDDG